ncbi:MAG: hypothetical protein ACAH09_10780 [Methylophilaceae bacterium]
MKKAWIDYIVDAMIALDGNAVYEDLYYKISLIHPGPLSKEWKATVRRTIETHSSDSDNFREGYRDLFKSLGGKGSGYWGLR